MGLTFYSLGSCILQRGQVFFCVFASKALRLLGLSFSLTPSIRVHAQLNPNNNKKPITRRFVHLECGTLPYVFCSRGVVFTTEKELFFNSELMDTPLINSGKNCYYNSVQNSIAACVQKSSCSFFCHYMNKPGVFN